MSFEHWIFLCGSLLLLMALSRTLLEKIPVSTPMIYLLIGVLLGPAGFRDLAAEPPDRVRPRGTQEPPGLVEPGPVRAAAGLPGPAERRKLATAAESPEPSVLAAPERAPVAGPREPVVLAAVGRLSAEPSAVGARPGIADVTRWRQQVAAARMDLQVLPARRWHS